MNEIEDHLDDSDEDTSYLVNANASTGEAQAHVQKSTASEQLAHSYYPEEKNDHAYQDNNYNLNNTNSSGYDNNYSNQYNNGVGEQEYEQYAQPATDQYNYNDGSYNYDQNNYQQNYDQNNQQ